MDRDCSTAGVQPSRDGGAEAARTAGDEYAAARERRTVGVGHGNGNLMDTVTIPQSLRAVRGKGFQPA
jgi:hypothetical protein